MNNLEGSIIVSIAGSGENTIVLVGEKNNNDIKVINAIQGQDAIDIFKKLKGVIDND